MKPIGDFKGFEISDVVITLERQTKFKLHPINGDFETAKTIGRIWLKCLGKIYDKAGYENFLSSRTESEIVLQKEPKDVTEEDIDRLNFLLEGANEILHEKIKEKISNNIADMLALNKIKSLLKK